MAYDTSEFEYPAGKSKFPQEIDRRTRDIAEKKYGGGNDFPVDTIKFQTGYDPAHIERFTGSGSDWDLVVMDSGYRTVAKKTDQNLVTTSFSRDRDLTFNPRAGKIYAFDAVIFTKWKRPPETTGDFWYLYYEWSIGLELTNAVGRYVTYSPMMNSATVSDAGHNELPSHMTAFSPNACSGATMRLRPVSGGSTSQESIHMVKGVFRATGPVRAIWTPTHSDSCVIKAGSMFRFFPIGDF